MNIRPRSKTQVVLHSKHRLNSKQSFKILQKLPQDQHLYDNNLEVQNTQRQGNFYTQRTNYVKIHVGSVSKRKKFIRVVSSQSETETQPKKLNITKPKRKQSKNINLDLLNSLRTYLQKTIVSTNPSSQYSAAPCDTPINKLSIFQQMQQNGQPSKIHTINLKNDQKKRKISLQKNKQTKEQLTQETQRKIQHLLFQQQKNKPSLTRQKIHIFSNHNLLDQKFKQISAIN